MGFAFRVCRPQAIFKWPYGWSLARALRKRFGVQFDKAADGEGTYCSPDLGFRYWDELQQKARAAVAGDELRHMLSVDAWTAVCLPCECEPAVLSVAGMRLQCASLPGLILDLETYAASAALPVAEAGLIRIGAVYDDDDRCDDDPDVQAFIAAVRAARVAEKRALPLWMIK